MADRNDSNDLERDAGKGSASADSAENISDEQIIARVCQGETDCFKIIVARYHRALLRAARSRLGREDWAEEAVQETFLSALRSCHTFDPRFRLRTWLWTILLNQCKNDSQRRARRAKNQWAGDLDALSSEDTRADRALGSAAPGDEISGSPLANLLAKERAEQLALFLNRLSPAQADALRLRFFGELKFQEIADAMDCSLSTAKNRVQWGLLRLSALLQDGELPGPIKSITEQERRLATARDARRGEPC